ncbi:glycosyltransferase family 2 protein [Paenibacillus aestuarii]|uniref:Glycosyltransferase family 2 protein n=1 Tax=Paenibacillus aestuarii TaxID=516965 RepID=A0ABW0K0C8_9BACL|nr:glycosyltransferase family 2 protein [Paenibacillus aestuarii]
MDNIDIVIVIYNSEKWITDCLISISKLNYSKNKLNLIFVDNNSKDNSAKIVNEYSGKDEFGSFKYIGLKENLGFGTANNIGVQQGNSPFVFLLNIDTKITEDCLSKLQAVIAKSDWNTAAWELRQFPYEHPKAYDPITLETSWCSAAALVVRRELFIEVGMFDSNIFMYCEDVDLSWKLRANGYKLLYVPQCVVYHFSYSLPDEVKPNQLYNATFNNLMLRYKYGGIGDVLRGYFLFFTLFLRKSINTRNHYRRLICNLILSLPKGYKFRKSRYKSLTKLNFHPKFEIWDFEKTRKGSFYKNEIIDKNPLVSILVRTVGRPNVLRNTLCSIRNQTYSNIEVIIVEDGMPISEQMIIDEFKDLQIKYLATREKKGRCVTANLALEMASGEFLNFLDDDDFFFADHIEVLVQGIVNNPIYHAAYSIAFEAPTKILSGERHFSSEDYYINFNTPFNYLKLVENNFLPIQTVLFSRTLYQKYGGMDTSLVVLEDWDLWLRYSSEKEFYYVEKVTSIYTVPYNSYDYINRTKLLEDARQNLLEKHKNTRVSVPIQSILEKSKRFKFNFLEIIKNEIKENKFIKIKYRIKQKMLVVFAKK